LAGSPQIEGWWATKLKSRAYRVYRVFERNLARMGPANGNTLGPNMAFVTVGDGLTNRRKDGIH